MHTWLLRLLPLAYPVGAALVIPGIAAMLLWYERRLLARYQVRLGPNRVGPQGLLQSFADILKLLSKEDIIPTTVDERLFRWAPVLSFAPVFISFAALPALTPRPMNIAILFISAVLSLEVLGVIAAGYGSHSKYALIGGLRAAAQMVSYEVPLTLAVMGAAMAAGTLNLARIVQAQHHVWYLFSQPLGAIIFLIAGMAEAQRPPFDLAEAESELVAGYHVEYSGVRFALFVLAEYSHMFFLAWLMSVLYLGGGGVIAMAVKIFILISIIIWMRATMPRIRADELMTLGWKILIPLASANFIWVILPKALS
ncbi:NADH:ubiquinone oxidoreductase subunit H [Candidatus Hydrogenisulfobacillus filiaventi]|uniref:NADH-quinone oxidoreductase subunit H n=1 Tax=Candidatus Hydrogenisulfobacillus filiaventi TaxID=2707344 RepID=A0A6F8ZK70_9FIRM|nr:NADH-quinone oxidoreductase subunit NuoH [Bacillota bacterium]CAB1129853.1 NADH:ubiquinone oxidoreductase subunit H [Candidatus Hydrogenisulfobacillus filiaventi]